MSCSVPDGKVTHDNNDVVLDGGMGGVDKLPGHQHQATLGQLFVQQTQLAYQHTHIHTRIFANQSINNCEP